jgi:hypothetical protein
LRASGLMSISVLKIMISLTLLWVSWYPLVTRLFRLLLIPDQSVWSKTENLLRNASHVLGTAEHFLSAVAPLLKD